MGEWVVGADSHDVREPSRLRSPRFDSCLHDGEPGGERSGKTQRSSEGAGGSDLAGDQRGCEPVSYTHLTLPTSDLV